MMPVIFIGHGSPMNAIENNAFTAEWEKLGKTLPRPKAILAISAHWFVHGTRILWDPKPKMTYDMYGFPKKLYEVVYNAPGATELAARVSDILGACVKRDNSWGYDHGTWSVLNKMYPKRDIPVTQLSINADGGAASHFDIGRKLKALREEGVLILASGNIVHNLRLIDWDNPNSAYPWAKEFDVAIKTFITEGAFGSAVNYRDLGQAANLAVPTPDHFYPLLYALGAAEKTDKVTVFNEAYTLGSLSMTSYIFG